MNNKMNKNNIKKSEEIERGKIRYFIGFDIPDEIKDKISEIQEKIKEERCIKIVERAKLHVTTNFLGYLDKENIDRIIEKINDINIEKREIVIKDLGFFPSFSYARVFWAGVYGSEDIGIAINEKIKYGEVITKGHLTIARIKCKPSNKFFENIEKEKHMYFGNFMLDKIFLFKSTLTKDSNYEKIYKKDLI